MAISQSLPTTDPAFRLNFQGARRIDPRLTFARASTATYVDEDGVIKTAVADQARLAYDPATGESLGLLLEESRTNYLFYSNMLLGWAFGTAGDAFTASSGSQLSANPDGSSPAYHYIPSTNAGRHRYNRQVTVPTLNTNYVVSLFVKRVTTGSVSNLNRYIELEVTGAFNGNTPGTGHTGSVGGSEVTFDLQTLAIEPNTERFNGYVGGAKIEQYPNGWYRLSYIFNPGIGGNFTGVVWWGHPIILGVDDGTEVGNGNPSFYFWGAQVELGTHPTSHIPTVDSAITRSADAATFTSQEISTTGTLLSLGGGSSSSPASYNSSEVNTATSVITLNSQLSDSSTIPTLLYYPESISGDAIKAMRAYTPIVKSGLVLHLDAGVDKSYPNEGTIWRDLSGQGNNGTLVNGPTYSSGNGGSLVFDGTNDRVTIVNSLPSLSNLTIELFLQTHVLDGSQRIFLDQLGSLRCELQNNRFNIHLGGNNGWFFTWHPSNTVLSPNVWYHFAWTWSSNTTLSRIYVNGVEDANPLNHGSAASSLTGDITLGQHTPDTIYNWNGKMSSVKIYNRALSSTEILQNFNASRSRFNI